MKKYTDKELAELLLEKRQHGGQAWRPYFKRNRWRLVFCFALMVFLLGLGVLELAWGFCGFVFGLVVGICSRDRVWLRQQQAVWPFYSRVIDWLKVEKIASGEPLA